MEAHSRSAGGHEATPDSYKYFKHPDLVPAFQAPVPQGQEAPDELHPEKSVKRAAAAAANVVTMVNQLATTRSRPQAMAKRSGFLPLFAFLAPRYCPYPILSPPLLT